MQFSFVTITYNHELFVIQHLNSIKYQILNFGQKIDFELIICDDCSKDQTIIKVNTWLEENRQLFYNVRVVQAETNLGIVNNYISALSCFSGDFFKVLAGDDLYSTCNLFDCVSNLKTFDLVQGAIFEFEKSDIMRSYKFLNYVNDFNNLSSRVSL
jgi:glycosyltransferase involved in cell wall biosynthesis